MAVSATNLISGPGSLYHGAFGATEPLDTAIATEPAAPPWTDFGGTQDGVTLTVNQEFFVLEMDQVVDAPGRRMTSRDVSVKTNLAEITLENLARVVNQDPSDIEEGAGYKAFDLEGDDAGAEPNYFALILRGRSPGGLRRHVYLRKVLSTGEAETAYKKGSQTLYPVTLSCHWVSPSIRPIRVVDEVAV